MDIVGPITPTSANGHLYILASPDYFSKWAEAVSLRRVTSKIVADFVRHHIVYQFGVPKRIISNSSSPFKNDHIGQLTSQFNIDWRYPSIYNPRENGQAKAFNKSLYKVTDQLHRSDKVTSIASIAEEGLAKMMADMETTKQRVRKKTRRLEKLLHIFKSF
ncbi:uncharacterized protein LOC110007692 [Amborella trichopoda]|uniref:uncharacterized protein LOC110007692 n=1 Tax=Amborella trichopoda TaxID=13333 RepID=UPI0009BFE804|nr:uncharacterized protein LOC110007692 [Amborella trichopoda]|eukprot:XP_020525870.1 uncharacterized protein LOC110007692 [Amborella trichopoda]